MNYPLSDGYTVGDYLNEKDVRVSNEEVVGIYRDFLNGMENIHYSHYRILDINGDGIYWLKEVGISAHAYRLLPYVITLVVLAFTSKSSRAPKAEGIPYDKSTR